MARKRKRRASYDIRPKSARTRKSWKDLSSSGKSYWRSKLDIRGKGERRANPLDRIKTATERSRYIRPIYRTPYQRRIVERTGATYIPPPPTEEDFQEEIGEYKQGKPGYGYDVGDFLSRSSHPDGYSYVLYHIFYSPTYTGGGHIETVRGQQFNTVEELRVGWKDDLSYIELQQQRQGKPMFYIRTIVAVVPESGVENTPGSVYPEDYHPKERPGTKEFEVEEGRRFLREQGPDLTKRG